MLKLIFAIFLCINYLYGQEPDGKYIDLLPEKEKADFLNQISRRILEEVRSEGKITGSTELTDDELIKHDEYVRQLLDEESKNLRKHEKNLETVIPLEKIEDDDRFIDLTLRVKEKEKHKSGRKVFEGFVGDNGDNNSDDSSTDENSDLDIQVKNFKREAAQEHTREPDYFDIKNKEITESILNVDDNIPELTTEKANSDSKSDENFQIRLGNTFDDIQIITNKAEKHNLNDHFESNTTNLVENDEAKLSTDSNVEEVTHHNSDKISSTTDKTENEPKPLGSRSFNEESINTTEDKIIVNMANTKELEDSNIINLEISSINNNVTVDFTEMPITETALLTGEESDYEKQSKVTETKTSKSITNFKSEEILKQPINGIETDTTNNIIETTTTEIEPLTTVLPTNFNNELEITTKGNNVFDEMTVKDYELNKNTKLNSNDKNVINKAIYVLRQNLLDENVNDEKKKAKMFYETNTKKEYLVYEISADSTPFLKKTSKKETKNKVEQPFKVSVYNYSPNNAYYNAHDNIVLENKAPDNYKLNNLGPEEDITEDLYPNYLDDDERINLYEREYNNNKKDRENNPSFTWDYFFSKNVNRKLKKFKDNKISLTPKNYLFDDFNKKDYELYYENNNEYKNDINKFILKSPKSSKDDLKLESLVNTIKSIHNFLAQKQTPSNLERDLSNIDYRDIEDEKVDYQEKENDKERRRKLFYFQYPNNDQKRYNKMYDSLNKGINRDMLNHIYILPQKRNIRKNARNYLKKDCPIGGTKCLNDIVFKNNKDITKTKDKKDNFRQDKKDYANIKTVLNELLNNNNIIKYKTHSNQNTERHSKATQNQQNNRKNKDYEFIRKILSIVDNTDVIPILNKLKPKIAHNNLKKVDKVEDIIRDVNLYVGIIKDMIANNSKALVQYDWLGSAVDLQSALRKMNDMVNTERSKKDMHPSDLELLNYLVYLHKTAKQDLFLQRDEKNIRFRSLLPRNRKKKRKIITDKGLMNRAWLIRKDTIFAKELKGFQYFLGDWEKAVKDLHTALKYISMITKYNSQNWFKNLKELNDFDRKKILELLVHIFSTRILELIEKSASNGLVNDYLDYIDNNSSEVGITVKEFVILLELLEELKYL